MSTDRFDSKEEVAFHPEAFSEGIRARQQDFDQDSQCGYEKGGWMHKSFIAGWCEADASMSTEPNYDAIRAKVEKNKTVGLMYRENWDDDTILAMCDVLEAKDEEIERLRGVIDTAIKVIQDPLNAVAVVDTIWMPDVQSQTLVDYLCVHSEPKGGE